MTFETASHTTEILTSGWQDIPYTMDISSSTTSKYVLCEMRYGDSSNVTPEEITAWTITYDDGIAFEIGDSGYPEPIDAPEPAEYAMQAPYPDSVFRIDPAYNYSYPFTALMPDIPMINIYPELRENVICVFDKSEPQNGFTGNGLAILHPTSCISLHNDDRWDIKLKHPIDEWGKWKSLLVVNILKVGGQLFRIKRQKPYIDSSGAYIEVEAKHITTDLADECCKDSEFEGGTASDFVAWAKRNVMHWEDERYADPYQFNISAAYEGTLQSETYPPATLLGLLVGLDNSLLARTGGELYRDNFDISISPRMQGARDNAFYIRYSLDMVEISQEIDYSDFCTLLYCYDNWGNVWAVSYAGTIQWAIHHQITKIVKFNYAEYDPERFSADCDAMKAASFKPKVTYKMKMAALRNDPKYAEFLNLQNYRYGDSGTIYCPELDIETVQKITEVEKDELTGEIVSITLGNLQSSIARPTYMGSTISSGYSVDDKNAVAMQRLLVGSNIASLQKFPINRLRIYRIKTLQGG
ncbi:MAG: phage tail protein [Ruminococcus sp.]|nr:phage tail protein [Ruminococcus sp.]